MQEEQIAKLDYQLRAEQEIDNQQEQGKKPGTAWLTFYTYFLLPFNFLLILFGLANVVIGQRYMQLPLLIASAIFIAMVFWGLHKRYRWGWQFNWFLLVINIMVLSYGYQIYNEYLIKLLDFTLIWGVPNLIYFSRRHSLFT